MKNKVQLITYADRFGEGNLESLYKRLQTDFKGLFGGIHLLPFFDPIDGEDAGFDPIDHTSVDKRLGGWENIAAIARDYTVMADMIVNHISADSAAFQDYLQKGSASEHFGLFLRMQTVFPEGASEASLTKIYRPRPGLPFSSYSFDNGEKALLWTTFSKKQIDIDVNHPSGRDYLMKILDVFTAHGVRAIRLDATGYAIKKQNTCCFMLPETFDFIADLKEQANKRNLEVLVEIHSHYATQIAIAQYADWVYDFALPPLVLHALHQKTAAPLKKWLARSPRNAITVLDTHDGIGIIDAGPSSSAENDGLLNHDEIDFLVDTIHTSSGGSSLKATGAAASNLDLYQINCTFFEALGRDWHKYLLARLIQFFSPGIPQIYYVGLLGGRNSMELLDKTGVGRDINRHFYSHDEITEKIQQSGVQQLFALIRFRNTNPAFDGVFEILESDSNSLHVKFSNLDASASLTLDFEALTFSVFDQINDRCTIIDSWEQFALAYPE